MPDRGLVAWLTCERGGARCGLAVGVCSVPRLGSALHPSALRRDLRGPSAPGCSRVTECPFHSSLVVAASGEELRPTGAFPSEEPNGNDRCFPASNHQRLASRRC